MNMVTVMILGLLLALAYTTVGEINSSTRKKITAKKKPPRIAQTYMTSAEVAKELGITSKDTIHNWLEGGWFPGSERKEDGTWRFNRLGVNAVKKEIAFIKAKNASGDLTPADEDEANERLAQGEPWRSYHDENWR